MNSLTIRCTARPHFGYADFRLRLGKTSKLLFARLALKFHETEDYTIYLAPYSALRAGVSSSAISSATGAWPPKSVWAYSKTPTDTARTSSRQDSNQNQGQKLV